MRLTCPNCGAQYEIDGALLPEQGRDVECSACGKVWFQPGQQAAPTPASAPAEPRLSRRLDESVLAVLREEAARELRARDAERDREEVRRRDENRKSFKVKVLPDSYPSPAAASMAPITAASGDKAAAPINADADQVKPGPKAVAAPPAPTAATLGKAAEHSTPSQRPDDAGLTGTANAPAMQTSSLQPARQPNQPPARRPSYENVTARRDGSGHQAATPQTVSPALLRRAHRAHDGAATSQRTTHQLPVRFTPPPRNRRYGLGFALGLAVMAAIAGLYLAAPKLAKGGWADAALTQFHSDADRGRFWLDQQVGQLLNRD